MTDFLDTIINLGDTVVLTAPNYRHLVKAEVIAFTKQKVRVRFNNTWNFRSHIQEYLSDPKFLVVVNN